MTVSSAELVAAVAKLNDLTRRKSITWSPADTAEGLATASYCAPYENSTIRITEYDDQRRRAFYDHPRSAHKAPLYRLEILDDRGNAIFVFPDIQGISDLFASVRARAGNAEEVIRALLNAK